MALNDWVDAILDRGLAIVLGRLPQHKQSAEIAADVASVTDQCLFRLEN